MTLQVVAGPHLLQVVTKTGLESYTARWGAVALAVTEAAEGEEEVCGRASWLARGLIIMAGSFVFSVTVFWVLEYTVCVIVCDVF